MSRTIKRTVSLAPENSAYIDALVKDGGYASTSEVVRAGLRALQERDAAIDKWLQNEVAPVFDAVKSGTAKTHAAKSVFDDLRNHHATKTTQ